MGDTRTVDINDLAPYEANARRGNIEMIRESLRVHGQFRPIVVQESTGTILAGNHTWMAAREEGWDKIDAHFIDVDDEQAKKIVLVDNRANDVAGYDIPSLAELLKSVEDLEGTGFDDKSLEEVMAALGASGFGASVDVDDAPALPESDPTTELGDLYALGRHRLLCGDSTSTTDFDRLIGEAEVDLIFTDPPYNMNFDGRKGKWLASSSERPQQVLMNDNLSTEGFGELLHGAFTNGLSRLKHGGSVYSFCDWRHYAQVAGVFSTFFNQKSAIIWDKTHFGMGVHYRMQYEILLFGCNGDKPDLWTAGKKERDVWQQQRENTREYKHVTQKPVELAERAIRNSSNPGCVVLDLFGGSGTTLIACEGMNRTCYMMELDRGYCDVVVKRWEKITGMKAVLCES